MTRFNREDPRTTLPQIEKELDALKADYITEQGVSGKWTYRKWASGVVECWASVTTSSITWTVYTSVSNSVYYSSANRPALPLPFAINEPQTFASIVKAGSNLGWASSAWVDSSNNATCTVIRSGDTGEVTVNFFVIGRWK